MKKAAGSTSGDGLSESSEAILKQVLKGKVSPGRRVIVTQALLCLDRLAEVRGELAGDDQTKTTNRAGLIEIEIRLREQFLSIWRRASLAWDPMVDGLIKNRSN